MFNIYIQIKKIEQEFSITFTDYRERKRVSLLFMLITKLGQEFVFIYIDHIARTRICLLIIQIKRIEQELVSYTDYKARTRVY